MVLVGDSESRRRPSLAQRSRTERWTVSGNPSANLRLMMALPKDLGEMQKVSARRGWKPRVAGAEKIQLRSVRNPQSSSGARFAVGDFLRKFHGCLCAIDLLVAATQREWG